MSKYYISIEKFQFCIARENIVEAVNDANKIYLQKIKDGKFNIADMPFFLKVNQKGHNLPNHSQILIPYILVLNNEWNGEMENCVSGANVTEEEFNEIFVGFD